MTASRRWRSYRGGKRRGHATKEGQQSYRGGKRRGHAPALLFVFICKYVNGLLPCGSVLDCGARRTARLDGEEDSILLPGLPISLL